ncbi:alpha-crystallin A chain-like [Schistocerca gregaria]|uniref:alpha-crystallin A chain-like n=1 Tax=Schistocerca gregaria TaxID=7010 RepID=UPI00211F2CB4|nr:alpha-crystallin A chain-like [Schistocerca gregaria]
MLASKPTTVSVNRLKPGWTLVKTSGKNIVPLTACHNTVSFSITVNVKHYLPEDITVSLHDTMIMVSATYENQQIGSSMVSQSLYHSTPIPQSVDTTAVLSMLSRDSILHVPAPDHNTENQTQDKPTPPPPQDHVQPPVDDLTMEPPAPPIQPVPMSLTG